jgi:hypothetical protein
VASYSQLCYSASHGNKETQNSHNLSTKEVFDLSINFESLANGCIKSGKISGKIESG